MLIISVLVILVGTKRRSALLLVLIPSCVLQRQWASAPALTQQQRNVYLLQLGAGWLAGTMTHSCVTGYPTHRHTLTFTHWCPMCSFTASYRDIDTHSYSLPLCFTHVNKTWHLWVLKACPVCMLIHLLLSMTCLTRPNTSPVCNRMHVWQSYSDLKMNYSQLTSALQGTAAHKVC